MVNIKRKKLEQVLEALEKLNWVLERAYCSTGYCCCGSSMDGHTFGDGHSPVDEGEYYQSNALEYARNAITAIKEALAQPAQEPVAWESILGAVARGWCYEENANKTMDSDLAVAIAKEVQALYTTPPAAQPAQEPVAWMSTLDVGFIKSEFGDTPTVPLYTAPPQRPWVELTDEEIYACDEECNIPQYDITNADLQSFAKAIEAKLKEKNT